MKPESEVGTAGMAQPPGKPQRVINRAERRRMERDPRYRKFLRQNTIIRSKATAVPVVPPVHGVAVDVVHEDESSKYPVEVNGEVQVGKDGPDNG
jgi:hypothetical protein